MTNERYEPTKAEMLAALVTGNTEMTQKMATVQRSHRFPTHLFIQIENMARVAGVPVSVIINELIDCGLEAVRQELPEDIVGQLTCVTNDQMERLATSEKEAVKRPAPATRNKSQSKK